MTKTPVAVIISDVHYSLPTLELADKAMRMAIDRANELSVMLIVAGDTHDTKANLRAECISAMRETFGTYQVLDYDLGMNSDCEYYPLKPLVLVGNHDKVNEKSEAHALDFLGDLVNLVTIPTSTLDVGVNGKPLRLIPYQHDLKVLRDYLRPLAKGSTLIMHQGLTGSASGDYIQDKTAINPQDVAGMRVISGHYHTRQDIELPEGGLWSYIGNPYTLNYAEAEDPPKGFRILNSDGTLDFVPTNLREHKVLDLTVEQMEGEAVFLGEPEDLLWVKIRGDKERLLTLTKSHIAYMLDIPGDFRLDLIPNETVTQAPNEAATLSPADTLDQMIDSLSSTSQERKERLKTIWKGLK